MTVGVSLNYTTAGNFSKQPDPMWAVPSGGPGGGGVVSLGFFSGNQWARKALASRPRWLQSQHLPPALLLLLVVPLAGQMSLLYLLSLVGKKVWILCSLAPTSGPRSACSIHPCVCVPEEKNKEDSVEERSSTLLPKLKEFSSPHTYTHHLHCTIAWKEYLPELGFQLAGYFFLSFSAFSLALQWIDIKMSAISLIAISL